MYSVLHKILSDKKGDIIFSCFDKWHIAFIILTLAAAALILCRLRKMTADAKQQTLRSLINAAFALYIADFFLMPLAYGEIDIEKLPFHVCTAMCVMCFISQHNVFLKKYRVSFALLGFISNLTYLIYPAGIMWHQIAPYSYRVIQTLSFHALMTVYGFAELAVEGNMLCFEKCYRELSVLAGMTLWAMLGNCVYNGTSDGYSHFFNWFFVVKDPFNIFAENVAPYIMPVLNIALFFAVELLIIFVLRLLNRQQNIIKQADA